MSLFSIILTIFGLCLFEAVSSVDNAIINAGVLTGMGRRARSWFLSWGILFAVFVIRGFLPWVIVWSTVPQLGFWGAFTATFSGDAHALSALEKSSPILLVGGGVFLVFLFLNWLFLETKQFALKLEGFFYGKGSWFYTFICVLLSVVILLAFLKNPLMIFGALAGACVFFVVHGLKNNAEKKEKELLDSPASDISKLLYLEVIDATFSIDGVLGAFAFTLSLPLILIGNGLGAFVVRQLTVGNIERVKKYIYLKNGAMYSVLFLGLFMVLKSFGMHIPEWISPVMTLLVVGVFFMKSNRRIRRE